MDYRKYFPKKYLAAHDLEGKDVVLTIIGAVGEDLESDKGKERKLILYFAETRKHAEANQTEEKRLVCNITNAKAIAKLHGNDADKWQGKKITLYTTTCQSFGETVDCIRIRPNNK